MRTWIVACVVAAAACRAEPSYVPAPAGTQRAPCPAGPGACVDMYFSTHEDDDLLFMNPDIETSIAAGNRVVVVYVTAGDVSPAPACSSDEEAYWTSRERGELAAYAQMTDPADSWAASVVRFDGKPFARYDRPAGHGHPDQTVTLLFARLRDRQLQAVWQDGGPAVTRACTSAGCPSGTVMASPTTYADRSELIATFASVMASPWDGSGRGATSVSMQDATGVYNSYFDVAALPANSEYPDHVFSSMLVLSAAAQYQSTVGSSVFLRMYRGYTVGQEPPDLSDAQAAEKKRIFAYYAQHDCKTQFAGDPEKAPHFVFGAYDHVWPRRTYAVRSLLGTGALTGRIALTSSSGQTGCLSVSGGAAVTTYACASAPAWTLTTTNQLRSGDSCLTASSGALTVGPCSPQGEASTFFLLSNGQLRAQHGTCVFGSSSDGGAVASAACDEKLTSDVAPVTVAGQWCIDEATGVDAPCATTNAALTATVSASSSNEAAPWSIHDINDGQSDSGGASFGYSSQPSTTDHAEWVELDLASAQPINHVVLYPRSDAGHVGQGFPRDFKIQVWNGSKWIDRVVKTGYPAPATSTSQQFGWDGTDVTDRIRITATSLGRADGAFALQLAEIAADQATGPIGKPPALGDWRMILDRAHLVSSQFGDSTEIASSASYYQTFRIAGRSICVRDHRGLSCARYGDGALADAGELSTAYSNATGWLPPEYGATVAAVDDAALGTTIACGRGPSGIVCSTGATSMFSDMDGWSLGDEYYGSIRYADVSGDGKPDVCGRAADGIDCAIDERSGFAAPARWTSSFSDAPDDPQGWQTSGTGDTIELADVNGDGYADVCGRGAIGIECALGTGEAFENDHMWSFDADRRGDPVVVASSIVARELSNADPRVNWQSSAAYYRSLHLVDLNRDGFADLCGRGPGGLYCALSVGNSFDRMQPVDVEDFTDALGWSAPDKGATITFGDLDGDSRVDVCGRGYFGVVCASGY